MSGVLDVRDLIANYGGRNILDGVNLQVHAGEIVTVIGHNGAGKSTLLRAIFNLVPRRRGHIAMNGRDVMGLASDQLLQAGLAYVPQHRSVFPRLTIEENLQMGGYLVRDARVLAQRIEQVLELFPVLKTRAGQWAGSMSGGEQRMLEIARTLLQDPQLIMLDEPSIGLAPKMVDAVFANVQLLRDQGKAVLMVEQNVKKALSISDRACVMELGAVRIQDQADRLMQDERVARLYLGQR
ncbi:MAG: ABC transporter ATP-binding protein [Betaproteobacteria bacterium]|nr:ABC transporter ATP-binding protein [Betaproteobacteria bacterium]